MKRYRALLWGCLLMAQTSYAAGDDVWSTGGGSRGRDRESFTNGGFVHGGGRTRRMHQGPFSVVPTRHATVVNDTRVIRNIDRQRRVEVVPNRYYWHATGGVRYAHYYYGGHHWYGFYDGPRFYWTRYHANHWWWYDPAYARWTFWAGGYWWWPAPTGVTYVYVNEGYVPYQEAAIHTPMPETPQAPPENTVKVQPDQSVTSPDGQRMVQIVGPNAEAYLYDLSSGQAVYMRLLDMQVQKVRFSGGSAGQPLQILVDLPDNRFVLYGADGNPLKAPLSNAPPITSPPLPPAP